MTSQLIDLVNTTNNIVYENLQKLNSKFKKIQINQTISEEEEYDALNCKINIYFTSFIEQMKTKFILATQEYEKQIEQNNRDILELIMENMLLKIEKDSLLEEKNKNDILSDYIDITIQKEKHSINANIKKNLNKTNSIKKHKKNNFLNNGIYSLIKSEFNNDNKNNNFSNNIYNYNLLDILNRNGSKKKKKTHSYNKFNNNNYNFNFIAGLDLNHYNTLNKKNVSYNGLGKTLYDSQDNIKLHKNKNSFSLNDFRKIKNAFSQKRTKKNSRKNIKNNNLKIYNHTNTNEYNYNNVTNDNCQKQSNDVKNISFSDNKIQFTEPSCNEHNKKKEKINFYCIKKIKEEMNEILKNKKTINTSNNNSNLNINTNGNVIDNANNANKAKFPLGYNYFPKNKTKININNNTNKKTSIQNKTPKNIKTYKQTNISEIFISDIYKDKNLQCKINYTIANNNQKFSPNIKKFKGSAKFSKISLYNSNINNNNIYDNLSLNINNKKKDLHNNFSGLKNLKKTKINNNINSKSYYKLNNKKNNISNDSNKKNQKEKSNINNFYYNDNINNNISYNLANKFTLSRNYSNIGNNFNNNTNTNSNYNTYYSNNNYKTINNFNKVNSGNINDTEGQSNIMNINTSSIKSNNIQGYNHNNNAFSMKIRNRINLSKNKMNVCLNNNNHLNKKNYGINNISMSYLLNNKEIDGHKNELKKYAFLCDENNKNETPSFYFIKK